MKNTERVLRKSYAMQRMAIALRRAIEQPTAREKERAARWAAAWGLLCGIWTEGISLRRADIGRNEEDRLYPRPDEIEIFHQPSARRRPQPVISAVIGEASPDAPLPPQLSVSASDTLVVASILDSTKLS